MVISLGPIRDLVFRHDTAFGPEPGVVVAGVVAEFAPFGIGDFELGDVEGVEIDRVDRAFAGFAVAEIVTHFERAGRDEDQIAETVAGGFGLSESD